MCCIPIHPSDVYKMNSLLIFGSLSEFIMLSLYLPCLLKKAMWCVECGCSNELTIKGVWCLACEEEAGRSWWVNLPCWPSIISPSKQVSLPRMASKSGGFLDWLAFVKNDSDESVIWSQQKSPLTISASVSSLESVHPLCSKVSWGKGVTGT